MTVRQILRPVSADLDRVRGEIENQLRDLSGAALPRFQETTDRATHQLFTVHGKLLRPALVLLTSRILDQGGRADVFVRVATAVELIHSASLVHDDVIDRADERRGVPSTNAEFGNKTAVLVGDLFYEQAFAVLTALEDIGSDAQIALLKLFTTTTREMCLGEIYEDEVVANPGAVSLEDYLRVIDYKTASLMSCCCRASAIVSGAGDEDSRLAYQFGYHLGRTYQLIDDVLDRDSVYFDPDTMLNLARSEGEFCRSVLEQFAPRDGVESLAGITDAVLKRAGA